MLVWMTINAWIAFTGWLADHTSSRRVPFLIGLFALAASTAILMAASHIGMFIAGRICQGLSAAVVWSVGLALLVDTVDQDETGQMLGTTGIAMGLGLLLAPLLGGIVFSRAGYYAVFGMCFGLLAVDILLRLVMIEKQVAAKWIKDDSHSEPTQQQKPEGTRPTDEERADNSNTESSIRQVASHTHSTISTTGGAAERSQAFLVLLSSPRVLATLWAALAVSIILTAFDAVLPIFVTTTFHWDSLGAGLIFLPVAIPSFLEPIAGWLADRYGSRWLATGGFVCTVPLLVLLRFVTHDSISQIVVLCVLLVGIGLVVNGIMTPVLVELTFALRDIERDRPGLFGKKGAYAQTYSLFNIAFAGGCLLGPIIAGLIRDASDWPTMTWSLSIIAAFSSITTAIWLGPPGSGPRLWSQ